MGFRIPCPNCGSRSYTEFWFGGEVPDPGDSDYERVWCDETSPGRSSSGGSTTRAAAAG